MLYVVGMLVTPGSRLWGRFLANEFCRQHHLRSRIFSLVAGRRRISLAVAVAASGRGPSLARLGAQLRVARSRRCVAGNTYPGNQNHPGRVVRGNRTGDLGKPTLWLAALLSTAGIGMLSWTRTSHHHVTLTIFAAGGSAASFALFDVLVQQWSSVWGIGAFHQPCWLLSLFFHAGRSWFPSPLSQIDRSAWPWLLGGSLVLAAQATIFISSVAYFRNRRAPTSFIVLAVS